MTNLTNELDFAPTRFSLLIDGGSDLLRNVVRMSDAVRAWDGTDSRFALQSNMDTNVHHGFEVKVTGRRVRLHKWGMAALRVQIRFDGEDEWTGADLLADAMDKAEVVTELAL